MLRPEPVLGREVVGGDLGVLDAPRACTAGSRRSICRLLQPVDVSPHPAHLWYRLTDSVDKIPELVDGRGGIAPRDLIATEPGSIMEALQAAGRSRGSGER